MISPCFDETDIVASICRESYYEFVKEFWDTIETARPVWNWHIEYLCKELQYIAELVFADCIRKEKPPVVGPRVLWYAFRSGDLTGSDQA